jgi:hypothetical protein
MKSIMKWDIKSERCSIQLQSVAGRTSQTSLLPKVCELIRAFNGTPQSLSLTYLRKYRGTFTCNLQ